MIKTREILTQWGIPFVSHYGVTLVERSEVANCIRNIFEENYNFYGYEGFSLHADGKVEPHMGNSASWSHESLPPIEEIMLQLCEAPPEVTHYELVFSK